MELIGKMFAHAVTRDLLAAIPTPQGVQATLEVGQGAGASKRGRGKHAGRHPGEARGRSCVCVHLTRMQQVHRVVEQPQPSGDHWNLKPDLLGCALPDDARLGRASSDANTCPPANRAPSLEYNGAGL